MIKNNIILEIEKHLDKKILDYNILSDSFGINCLKIATEDKERYIVKYYYKKKDSFNAIESEANNLIYLNAHKFNFEKAKVFTWMAVMMKNRCIDRIRAKKRRIPLYEVDDYTESSITEPDSKNAVDILKQKEKASIVLKAVKQLPEPQREVIELVFYKEMTHVQVAEHLGISIGTAKSRIRYAYQRLRDALGNNTNLDRN